MTTIYNLTTQEGTLKTKFKCLEKAKAKAREYARGNQTAVITTQNPNSWLMTREYTAQPNKLNLEYLRRGVSTIYA